MNVALSDIRNAHKHHRLRLKRAKHIIDNSPPLLDVVNFARFSKMKEDVATFISRYKQNAKLLIALNKVERTKGVIDSFRTEKNSITPTYSKLAEKHRWLQQIDNENIKIGKKILDAKPKLNTWLGERFLRKRKKKQTQEFHYPELVMSKYSNLEMPSDALQLQMLLRPKIWFKLELKDVRPLGNIAIELYTEAAPQVVMEFVRLCFAKQNERVHFVRLFPNLWLEGNILLDDKTLLESNIEYDKRAVDHSRSAGILSFNQKTVFCPAKCVLNFSISFKSLPACNGRRVGFGRISQGIKVLKSIQDCGNKNGKLYKEIIVTCCGISD